ncbi:MAG TPA: glycosyltransferase family 39 protein [Rhizomicrobium sp.]|nr:glycosyltransferase family 39 protein [Rhizomicrobium sp.]
MSHRGAGARKHASVWAALADPQIVVSILILYCLFHFLLRLLLSANYTLDESEQILFGQSLEWGYRFRHPPLITWLTWGTLAATANSRVAFFLLKYALMLLGLVAYFQAARLVIRDDKLAGLATFGLLTTVVMGYMPHIDLMHTVLLATMLAAYLWADARVLTRGRWGDYALLGAVAGLGILSKYVFLVLPVAMGIGTALVPRLRARLKPAPLVLALAIAIAIVAPYAWWAKTHEYSLFALAETITKSQGPAVDVLGWLKGTGNLIVALVGFVIPFAAIFAILYWPACKKLGAAGSEEDRDWHRMYAVATAAGIVIMWGAVFFVGTEAFKERWMHQVMMPLPILLFLRAKMAGDTGPGFTRADRVFVWCAAVFAVAVFAARIAIYETGGNHCKVCREYWPMQTYATDFRRNGFSGGTILAPTYDLAGNLRGVFPQDRVVTPGYPLGVFGPPEPGQCLVVWEGEGDVPKTARDYLEGPMGAKIGNDSVRGFVSARLTGTRRMDTMSYLIVPSCR